MTEALETKASKASVSTALKRKVNRTDFEEELSRKVNADLAADENTRLRHYCDSKADRYGFFFFFVFDFAAAAAAAAVFFPRLP